MDYQDQTFNNDRSFSVLKKPVLEYQRNTYNEQENIGNQFQETESNLNTFENDDSQGPEQFQNSQQNPYSNSSAQPLQSKGNRSKQTRKNSKIIPLRDISNATDPDKYEINILNDLIYPIDTDSLSQKMNQRQSKLRDPDQLFQAEMSSSPKAEPRQSYTQKTGKQLESQVLESRSSELSKGDKRKQLVLSILNVTLETYNINHTLTAEEFYDLLDPQQLKIFATNIEKSFIQQFDRQNLNRIPFEMSSYEPQDNCFMLDLGHYPLTPFLNPKVANEKNENTKQLRKFDFFYPPQDRDDLIVVLHKECSSQFALSDQNEESQLLTYNSFDKQILQDILTQGKTGLSRKVDRIPFSQSLLLGITLN
ncbi:UNKNOWN [Stylonychia lemnae]|uniref:Uncharacterized protein n=1 Tax=Stylonychia lemnae TaxID=5949 RepID=A0A078AVG5_STYLE|nr:UNKNOWN [Stylonychia lemnae]|eukprot:CDW86046.1 UNKNOWN [Stylonychia lemnae]